MDVLNCTIDDMLKATDLHSLTSVEKCTVALELSNTGVSRLEIATKLFNAKEDKTKLNSLRKLMNRSGYKWADEIQKYIHVEDTENNKQVDSVTNKQLQLDLAKVEKQVKQVIEPSKPDTSEALLVAVDELKAIMSAFKLTQPPLGLPDGQLSEYKAFKGLLQGTTMQLHQEVWDALNSFCKKHRVTKKAVVNQAIWDFLLKKKEEEDAKGKNHLCK